LIEGFTGGAAAGIEMTGMTSPLILYGHNAFYNNNNDIINDGDKVFDLSANDESLGSSPFAKSGADTFANRFTYFAPANVGSVQGGAYPTGARLDKGAVQHTDPAGGGGGSCHIIGG
jgi:hypothetical protein